MVSLRFWLCVECWFADWSLAIDNPINQTILSAFMRKKGIRYEVACNGEEAVNKWKTGGFHLILVGSFFFRYFDSI